MTRRPELTPRLVVANAARAIDLYTTVFGAREVARFTEPRLGDLIVHAELALGAHKLYLVDEHREWGNLAPTSLGGTPVLLSLEVDDVDAVGARLVAAGAKVLIPIADQFYGAREGRFADPFGHVWILGSPLRAMSNADIQGAIDRGDV